MKPRRQRTQTARVFAMAGIVGAAGALLVADRARAEERKFTVMLAHSPKSFATGGVPGLPPGGLADVQVINREYFDRNPFNGIESFTEYWEEISYGDVTVTGQAFGWVTLPWAFEPDPPNADARPSPVDFIDLRVGNMTSEATGLPVPFPYAYGAGEDFCDTPSSLDTTSAIRIDDCGALIIIDPYGTRANVTFPLRAAGLDDSAVVGINVWTPGERFVDADDDLRWDGLDELNDRMCHGPDGCGSFVCAGGPFEGIPCTVFGFCPLGTCVFSSICAPSVCSVSGVNCSSSAQCPAGQSCVVATGTCSYTGAFCRTSAQCPAGVCQGVCNITGGPCVDRDDCPNPLEACVGAGSEQPCGGINNVGCAVSGETCGDPPGSGPRGCNTRGCGDLAWPWIDWNASGDGDNPSGDDPTTPSGCTIPESIACTSPGQCDPGGHLTGHPFLSPVCLSDGLCEPTNCVPDWGNVQLLECCDNPAELIECVAAWGIDITPGSGNPAAEGITCGDPIFCCEFVDSVFYGGDGDGDVDVVEPFEDFMIRWNPAGRTPGTVWARVDEDYVRNNYPGDVETLVRRTGNGYYDSPDLFIERNRGESTKMVQDAGQNRFAWKTPKPGARKSRPLPPGSAYLDEESWFQQWWTDRYGAGSVPPCWPGCDARAACQPVPACDAGNPPFNSPRMRPFDPDDPVPPVAEPTAARRWFHPNRGGVSGFGAGIGDDNHWPGVAFPDLELGTENPPFPILPEEEFGYYDGWVEHDDLPSSKYHRTGDKRLGEITSPGTDTVDLPSVGTGTETYTAIFGADLGRHNANSPVSDPDELNVAAGPYAVKIHGEKGFDAGDVCILEWLTWRTNGTSPTIAYQWEVDNGPYHPFAGPHGNGFGFRDYNLDGMIDQGEVRPALSESYSADSNPYTENNGTESDYPFNRRRLVEDVIEALDPSVDWDDFNDANSRRAALCRYGGDTSVYAYATFSNQEAHAPADGIHNKTIYSEGLVSGIVLVPPAAYTDANLFPRDPSQFPYFPVHNEDNDDDTYYFPELSVHQSFNLHFHDQVVCQNCRPESPAVTPYAAHEYGHAWEGWPDLYDYDVFGGGVDGENCPVGAWDIMAGVRGTGDLIHPAPILKEQLCTAWTDPVDLTTVVTPGVETTLTLPPAELVRDNSYFFLENEERRGEKYYFWSVGSGFDQGRLPAQEGMLMMHTDIGVSCDTNADCPPLAMCVQGICVGAGTNIEGLPLQQRTPPWAYLVVQADGRSDLEACGSYGNRGDAGDIWPGSTNATQFNFDTDPSAAWQDTRWTGLNITNIQPDGNGSVLLTLSWVPTNIPSLRFSDPPVEQRDSTHEVSFEAMDVYGGTTIELYYTTGDTGAAIPSAASFIGSQQKPGPATRQMRMVWDITGVPDGRYFLFAKLVPGSTDDGTERRWTTPRASRNNVGDGTLNILSVDATSDINSTARSETWTVVCIDSDGDKWLVSSSLSQPEPPAAEVPDPSLINCPSPTDRHVACTGSEYTSIGGEVKFTITAGSEPFALDDTFTFTTTGITATSRAVTIEGGRISEDPRARICASTLSGEPPLEVTFRAKGDAGDPPCDPSFDPNGEPLEFLWRFGDGSPTATGSVVTHTYHDAGTFTAVLLATNSLSGRFDEAAVDINVINNSPRAQISAAPTSGTAPLEVQFDGSGSSDSETPANELVYQWDFGDGFSANDLAHPGLFIQTTHTYVSERDGTPCTADAPCEFTAMLTVTDSTVTGIGRKTGTATVKILVGNSIPEARVTATPTRGLAPLTVRFNAINSTDADGDTLTVDWDFDDGPTKPPLPITGENGDGDGIVSHTYEEAGTYEPTARVYDGHPRGEDTWSGQITVTEPVPGAFDPVARFTIDPDPPVLNEEFTVDASGSYDRCPDPPCMIASYSWDWGDGTKGSGVTATHTYNEPEKYTIRLTVSDDEGNEGSTPMEVEFLEPPTPGNEPPEASFTVDPPSGFAGDTKFTFDATASRDPDGDDDKLSYSWDFDDESPPASGDVVTHTYGEPNRDGYVVRLTVTDQGNASRTVTKVVLVVEPGENLPPNAFIATGLRSGTAPLPLRFNGSHSFDPNDPNGLDPLTFTWEIRRKVCSGDGEACDPDTNCPRGETCSSDNVCSDSGETCDPNTRCPNGETCGDMKVCSGNGKACDTDVNCSPDGGTCGDKVALPGDVIDWVFESEGIYKVTLTVVDGTGLVGKAGPETVLVTEWVTPPDGDEPGQTVPDGDGPIWDSADQRPTRVCGFGMLMSLFGSLLGLAAMTAKRRRG